MPPTRSITSAHAEAGTTAVGVIVVIFTVAGDALQALLVRRSGPPEEGKWALPGGLLTAGEAPDEAAIAKLRVETGVTDVYLEQLYTFGNLDDTRASIAVTYFALVDAASVRLRRSDEWQPAWHDVAAPPPLAFHNDRVVGYALERLRAKLGYTNVAYSLMPDQFTLSQLQRVYEAIAGRALDKRNFRRRMLSLDILKATGSTVREGAHRPAQLYEFASRVPMHT